MPVNKSGSPAAVSSAARLSPQSLTDTSAAAVGSRWQTWTCWLLAALPICFVALQVATWIRNVPNWDEFDSALEFLIVLNAGASGGEIIERLLAVTNEHRTFVSRLIFASAYWISGGINFLVLAIIGNLFLLGVFAQLVLHVKETGARLRLAAIFALVVFQLQHHENLFWSGSSIDHFFVVLAVAVALGALASPARWSLPVACAAGFLATFSLAHGLLVWLIGAGMLGAERRWRAGAVWIAAALIAGVLYFAGFQFNAGHRLPGIAEMPRVIVFWLTLAGSSPALDDVTIAPWWGATLVLGTLLVLRRGVQPRERLALGMLAWCLGAMAMIAWGRALLSSPWAPVTSRYLILSSIAWALLVWILVERGLARSARPGWWLGPVLAALAAFNIAANAAHLAAGRVFAQNAENAVLAFHRDGTFAKAEPPLYPDPDRADALVREAERRNIFHLPKRESLALTGVVPVELHETREIDDAVYFIETVEAGPASLRVRGWGFRPDEMTRLGDVSMLLRSAERIIAFEPSPRLRPDVAEAYERADAIYSGFDLSIPRELLPEGEFGIGVSFDLHGSPEYMMTANTIVTTPDHVITRSNLEAVSP